MPPCIMFQPFHEMGEANCVLGPMSRPFRYVHPLLTVASFTELPSKFSTQLGSVVMPCVGLEMGADIGLPQQGQHTDV